MFELRKQLVSDFSQYVNSFLRIRDEQISSFLQQEMERGTLWPEPLIQLNPSFEKDTLAEELVDRNVLDSRCSAIFKRGKSPSNPTGNPLRLFSHQVEAIYKAREGRNYILTTGTGSGKSLSYILPIVDAVLKEGSGQGIRAIVVYPMNALANSQLLELEKYLGPRDSKPFVTYERYTGQESQEDRDRIVQTPPDILLTNYMMLELILTRVYEGKLVEAMQNLRFVVLDELHTYRGRQGADVALLMRRLAERSGSKRIQYIGTSATMASEGKAAEKRRAIADVGSLLFGTPVAPEDVIGETLEFFTEKRDVTTSAFINELIGVLDDPPPTDLESYRKHPLTIWIENEFGLTIDDEERIVRGKPKAVYGPGGIAEALALRTNICQEKAEKIVEAHLLGATQFPADPRMGTHPFVFRLHQFFSPGIGIFASLAPASERFLSLQGQKSAPEDPLHFLFPLCFCRECGQHYYIVNKITDDDNRERFVPRRLLDIQHDEKTQPGFLYIAEPNTTVDLESLIPDDWREDFHGCWRVKKARKDLVPCLVNIDAEGVVGGPMEAWFVPQPFSLCMQSDCGISYEPRESDITKLSVLGSQGRSTATTILSLSALNYLRKSKVIPADARKLLSFTDNRQDASLQAGHLNDFMEVGLLRAAIYRAAKQAGEDGVTHDNITIEVEKQLALEQSDYAQQVVTLPTQINQRVKALRDVLGYRIYRDLRRGWRINAPNLEQIGLLKIEYPDLYTICNDETRWVGCSELLLNAKPETREKICRELLDRMRRKLAIRVDYLDTEYQEGMRQRSSQLLKEPWGLSEDEAIHLDGATYAWLNATKSSDKRTDLFLTPNGAMGIWLRTPSSWGKDRLTLPSNKTRDILNDLVAVLTEAAIISMVKPSKEDIAYQLNAESFIWKAAIPGEEHRRYYNEFFERFYREQASNLKGIYAREHTAQVSSEERQERERQFRSCELPILFCSPTMELGVDIADLSVVNMRNIPPTPANYAQRSGRAGRNGQPALVFSYCTAGSPHDQYYFRRPEEMVMGAVAPPRLDVANEDLVRAHVHAIWLGEMEIDLGKSLADRVLDVNGDNPTLELQQEITEKLSSISLRDHAKSRAKHMLSAISDELINTNWYTDRWLDDVIDQAPRAFDSACDRWRNLYKCALEQAHAQDMIIRDATSKNDLRKQAERLRKEAEQQLALLRDVSNESFSDFYVYRYLASEGFLPGYNFPRLPLTAFLPGRRESDEYLSRPRFLAISEFGPGAIIYHEGARYLVDRVLMPTSARDEDGKFTTSMAKVCPSCGYIHKGEEASTVDVCDHCGKALEADAVISNMFRLEAVSLRRKDRITCDEEERMRQGYEIRTGIRFQGRIGEEQCIHANIMDTESNPIAKVTYSQTATIWRVNVGWNRRKENSELGYQLDLERSQWISETGAVALETSNTVLNRDRVARVVPYVEDRRNALVFEWASPLTPGEHASLQSALKSAIQTVYQLEDNELAAEPLPSRDDRRMILFYESAEGGAGVLRRLVEEKNALHTVAKTALKLCHFDPDSLEDLKKDKKDREACSSACYDCLMSYGNQRDHLLLDRKLIVDLLAGLRDGRVEVSGGSESRSKQLEKLMTQCGSDLERQWLKYMSENKLNLPTHAQYRIAECSTVPDFAYIIGANKLAVYIDGPPHDYPMRQNRDSEQDTSLMLAGWLVLRFHHADNWDELIRQYPSVFGGKE